MTALGTHPAVTAAQALDQPAFISLVDPTTPGDGPLTGIAVAVKDNIDVEGVATTAGNPLRSQAVERDATAVGRLRASGAVVIGKTNLDQYATGLVGTRSPYGACHSVFSSAHISGGSSSGSAVAVAAGVVPLALGTDTAGSGRVPAAFNGLIGVKPTRGLVPVTGVVPACPSLDCVTTLTRDVATARTAMSVLAGFDPSDPWSRRRPAGLPEGIAATMRVIAVPSGPLDLDEPHRQAWEASLAHAATVAHLVPVDVTPFLEAARLLYSGAFVAERYEAFGAELAQDGAHLDPTVRKIVLSGGAHPASAVFSTQRRLQELRSTAAAVFVGVDALMLPVTPGHPTLADVAADPVGVNARMGTYTNMVNLLDLCAVAVPSGMRADGLPFGVQFLAPAFADQPLLEFSARWLGEPEVEPAPSGALLAVAGAHLSGQPANPQLVALGGRLHSRARTGPGYRMYRVPGPFPRPGLVASDGPAGGVEVEVWDLPQESLSRVLQTVAEPLAFGRVRLDDGSTVTGFVSTDADPTREITSYGGWRSYLAAGGA